jgi:uncharacterized linocin/CFP29 family protein
MLEKYLNRNDTPFSQEFWQQLDQTVVQAAKSQLSGRRVLTVDGPYGLGFKAFSGLDKAVDEKLVEGASLSAGSAVVLPLISSTFRLSARDIAAFDKSASPLDLSGAARAAIACARMEDRLVFMGSTALNLPGLFTSKQHRTRKLSGWDQIGTSVTDVLAAVGELDAAGFTGPYALALSPAIYNMLFRRYPDGQSTELEHIRQIVTEGIFKVPAISSGGCLINTGRQFLSIVIGQDLTTGFVGPVGTEYEFIIFETLLPRLAVPEAVCTLE